MGVKVDTTVLDGSLDIIATATEMYICTAEPADRAAAITANLITAETLTGADFVNAAGDVSGRKVTIGAQADLAITADGTATHIALCSATLLILVTTCTSQGLSNGGTVSVPAFKYEATVPTAA
jgi:hypothetical protein